MLFSNLKLTWLPEHQMQRKPNHESTKFGKHEKGPGYYILRAFVPRQIAGGQVSCFRDGL
jgi:hypothetical protein